MTGGEAVHQDPAGTSWQARPPRQQRLCWGRMKPRPLSMLTFENRNFIPFSAIYKKLQDFVRLGEHNLHLNREKVLGDKPHRDLGRNQRVRI